MRNYAQCAGIMIKKTETKTYRDKKYFYSCDPMLERVIQFVLQLSLEVGFYYVSLFRVPHVHGRETKC